jgi:hypothetical protein
MTSIRSTLRGPAQLVLALALTVSRAYAGGIPGEPASTDAAPGHSLAARGPLALALAAEPGAFHWGVETGFPLGLGRRDGAGKALSSDGPWRLDAWLSASQERGSAANVGSLATSLMLARLDARGATWWGISQGGPTQAGDPDAALRLGFGRAQWISGVHAELAWITSSVLFKNDPRWFHTRTLRVHTQPDTGAGFDTDTTVTDGASHTALWNTAQGSLRWQRGRLALGSVAGLSLGDGVHARRWAQATLDLQLTRRVVFMASLGERPAPALAFSSGAQPRTMLGIQFAPWSGKGWAMNSALRPIATKWEAHSVGHNYLLVRVHGRNVSRVDLSGDFTDWTPVALLPVHANWWAVVVRVPPGVHRVQLRVDGGPWIAPPGLPRADNGPGGPSGALVVAPPPGESSGM